MVVVSSGAIALGLPRLGLPSTGERPEAPGRLRPGPGPPAGRVGRRSRHGIQAAQILLTAGDIAERAAYVNARNALSALFRLGAVPIVNENDATATDEITFGDNDALAAQVAVLVQARLLVLLTEVEGVLTGSRVAGSRADPGGLRRPRGRPGQASPTGKGGMRSKVLAAEMAASAGIDTVIAGGAGRPCSSRSSPGSGAGPSSSPAHEHSAFKLWLRFGKPVADGFTSTRVRGGQWPVTARACSRSASSAARAVRAGRRRRARRAGRAAVRQGDRGVSRRTSRAAPAGSRPSTATGSSAY